MLSIYELVKRFKNKYPLTIAWRLKSHSSLAEQVLDEDEDLMYVFCGQKNDKYNSLMSSNIVLLTDKRIILCQRRFFYGYFITTITKDMINDIEAYTGLIWGKIIIDSIKEEVTISFIDKSALDNIMNEITDIMGSKTKRRYK